VLILSRDIIDTTPSTWGNLWKMILGPIGADYGEVLDDEGDATSSKIAGSHAASPVCFSQPAPNEIAQNHLQPTALSRSTTPTSSSMLHQLAPKEEPSWLAGLPPTNAPVLPSKWPNQETVGEYCGKFGEQKFWEIQDPGREKLAPLKAEVQKFLSDGNEHLTEQEPSDLRFSIFMVGRNESTSSPTLVIISTNKKSREMFMNTIRSSGVLDKYEGVLLASSSQHPRHLESGPAKHIVADTEVVPSSTSFVFSDAEVAEPSYALPQTTTGVSTTSY
jgi:hypothetical protein